MSQGQVFRGTVTRIVNGVAKVTIAELGKGTEYSCEILHSFMRQDEVTEPATVGDLGTHVHTIDTSLNPGDRVLVAMVAGIKDDLVVMGKLP